LAVINLTGTKESMPASLDMELPGPDGVRCCLSVRERHLQEEPALPLLQANGAGQQGRLLLALIPLHKTDDIEEVVRLWLELWSAEPDERLRTEYVILARVFAELSKHRDRWRKALEGLTVGSLGHTSRYGGLPRRLPACLRHLSCQQPNAAVRFSACWRRCGFRRWRDFAAIALWESRAASR
jgi:hypothetical protein